MRFAKGVVAASALLGLGILGASGARAQTVTFAQFTRSDANPGYFTFTNNGNATTPGGTLSVLSGSVPVFFVYQVSNGYGTAFAQVAAHLVLTATASGAASITTNSGSRDLTQGLTNVSFEFVADNPKNGNYNLLSGTFSTGTLKTTETFNSGTGTYSPSGNATFAASGVTGFASNFLDFTGSTLNSFSWSFSAAINNGNGTTTGASSGNGPQLANENSAGNNGALGSFAADGTGTFSANPAPTSFTPVPATPGETSAMIGLAVAGAQFGMVRLRRRNNAKKEVAA